MASEDGSRRDQVQRMALEALLWRGPLTRAELATAVGLTTNALTPFIEKALAAELLIKGEAPRTNGPTKSGPPPETLAIDHSRAVVVGVDFGPDYQRARIADLSGKVYDLSEQHDYREEGPYDNSFEVSEDPERALAQAANWVRRLVNQVGKSPEHVAGIGIGVAGPVGPDRTNEDSYMRDARVMPGWESVPIKTELRQYLQWGDRVAIHVDNDATLGLLAELRWGAARPTDPLNSEEVARQIVLFLRWTTGLGMGLAIGGAPYRGSGNIAGEFGHVPVTVDREQARAFADAGLDWPPDCTRRCEHHCLERVAARHALIADFTRRTGNAADVDEIVRQARAGHKHATATIEQAAHYVGQALVPIINVLNPSLLVVGGLVGGQENFPVYNQGLASQIRKRALPAAAADYKTRGGEVEAATVNGAIALAIEHEAVRFLHRSAVAVQS